MSDRMTHLGHARARHAWRVVDGWGDGGTEAREVKGLPVLIRTQGLATALALTQRGARSLVDALVGWLGGGWPSRPKKMGETMQLADFMRVFLSLEPREAAAVEREGLRYAEALKIVSGVLKGGT